jgi:ferredoxin--NADP+ reductase
MQEFEKMKEIAPDNFRLEFAVSREQKNASGEKMYIQTRIGESAEEFWQLLKKENTFVYMCGLKGMEKGIDDAIAGLAERDGKSYSWFLFCSFLPTRLSWGISFKLFLTICRQIHVS